MADSSPLWQHPTWAIAEARKSSWSRPSSSMLILPAACGLWLLHALALVSKTFAKHICTRLPRAMQLTAQLIPHQHAHVHVNMQLSAAQRRAYPVITRSLRLKKKVKHAETGSAGPELARSAAAGQTKCGPNPVAREAPPNQNSVDLRLFCGRNTKYNT